MSGVEARNQPQGYLLSVVGAAMAATILLAQSHGTPDGSAILDEMTKQQTSLPPYAFQTETQADWKSPAGQGATVSVYQMRSDGDRTDIVRSRYQLEGETRIFMGVTRALWDGNQYLLRWKLNTLFGEETPLRAAFSSKRERVVEIARSAFNGGFLAGYLDVDVHICDQLKKAPNIFVRPNMEDVKGSWCYVLTADIEGKDYTLWIDPEKGFNIRQAVIEETDPTAAPAVRRLEDVEIRKVNDLWIPVSGMLTITSGKATQTFRSQRPDIVFNPDFEEMQAFRMDQIPDGMPIINLDVPAQSHVWKGGKIVPDIGSVDPMTPHSDADASDDGKADSEALPNGHGEPELFLSQGLESLGIQLLKEPAGIRIAQQRTDAIIAKLKQETAEDSLSNLDHVDDFYYPGFFRRGLIERPFDTVQMVLSNRRFIKLYDDLKAMNGEEQYRHLSRALEKMLSQYGVLVSRLVGDPTMGTGDPWEIARISDDPARPPTLAGTRLAIQSISLLCGVLGNAKMWPELRAAFQHPYSVAEVYLDRLNDESDFLLRGLTHAPVFSLGIQAQTIWLLSQYAGEDEQREYGFDSKSLKSLVSDDMCATIEIPDYQARVTMYDHAHKSVRKPIDMSYGSYSFRFLVTDNIDALLQLTAAFGLAPRLSEHDKVLQ